jgi:hypothetical protein
MVRSVRHRDRRGAGRCDFVIDFAYPEPSPALVTTIAWRLAHLITGVFGTRVASHLGGSPVDYQTFHYAGTAAQALQQLDQAYSAWVADVKASVRRARPPVRPRRRFFADYPMAALVLHVNREARHHGAEIALLRDLYANR